MANRWLAMVLQGRGPPPPSPFSSSCPHHVSLEKNQDKREAREVSRVQNVSRHSRLRIAPCRPRTKASFNVTPQSSYSPRLHLGACGQGHQARNGEPLLTSQSRASVSTTATHIVGRGRGGCSPAATSLVPWMDVACPVRECSLQRRGEPALPTHAPTS